MIGNIPSREIIHDRKYRMKENIQKSIFNGGKHELHDKEQFIRENNSH